MAAIERRSGSYSTRLSLTDTITGKRRQQRVTARTKRELDAEVARVRNEFNSGLYVEPDKTTLATWMTRWHATLKSSPATRYRRGVHIRNHINPDEIGGIPLSRLRYSHLQDWVDRLTASGLSPTTIRAITTTLGMALSQAVKRRLIVSNPCSGLDLPPASQRRWRVLDEGQARRLVTDTTDDAWHACWVLAVTLGLRRGELLALRWSDVDLTAGVLRVERSASVDEDGHRMTGERAKSAASQRSIRLPTVCVDALKRQRARQNERRLAAGDVWSNSGAVLDSGLGEAWEESAVYRAFKALKTQHDIAPETRFHDLRHTAATHMLHAGVPIPTVAKILGHANPAITMRVYSHVLASMEEDAANLIDGLYQPGSASIVTTVG